MKKNRCNVFSVFLSVMICVACHNVYTPLCLVENPVAGAESEKEVPREIVEVGRAAVRHFSISFRSNPVPRIFKGHFCAIVSLSEKIPNTSFPEQVIPPGIQLTATVLRV